MEARMIDRLIEAIEKKGAPIVVGLDPMLRFVPEKIVKGAFSEYGQTLQGAAEAVWRFNRGIVDAVCDLVAAAKPQIAMYEQFGVPGLEAFRKTVDYCHQKGLLVIGDVKRGDIGSTAQAYADAHLGSVDVGDARVTPFGEDFATVNPYLGSDGVEPFLRVCREKDKGIFILVKTSNPGSGEFQDRVSDGRPLYEWVGEKVAEWGASCMPAAGGGRGYSEVGAVVGATYPEVGERMRKVMPRAYLLVPGYGAQGASGKDLAPFFNPDGLGAIVNSSRGIIAAWQQGKYGRFGGDHFADAARQAVLDMKKDLKEALAGR